jgi:hypothetical protein
MRKTGLVVLLMIVLAACAPVSEQAKETLEDPVNCATAEGDLRVLENEKAHVAERVARGVTSVMPAGIVMGILTRTQKDKMMVAAGKYNEMIDEKIAQIKEQCGLE